MKQTLLLTEEKMKASVAKLKQLLYAIRTGRASAGLLESVRVDYYGTPTPVNQMASVLVPDPKTIEIKPYDLTQIAPIEKAILAANIGFTPQSDGKVVRIKVPSLTEERRVELCKSVKKIGEDEKIILRQERRTGMELLKSKEKEKKITEDEKFKGEQELQKMTDRYIKTIDETVALKEKEIMTV